MRLIRLAVAAAAAAIAALGALPAPAQAQIATVVASCPPARATPYPVSNVNTKQPLQPLTVDVNGILCTNATGGGGGGGDVNITQIGGVNVTGATAGSLPVSIVAGGGSGGTASAYGAAFPAQGTAIGVSDGTNMIALRSGTAGTAAPTVLTVQGIASGTAIPVSGTFWQATQPVSGTVAFSNSTIAVTNAGTFATQPASATAPVSTMNSASANAGLNAALAGVFDDTSPTSITENSFGFVRMSANRNLYGTIRDAAGNERGANVDASSRLTTAPTMVSGSINSGAVASGAYASGAFASGAFASGSIASGAMVDLLTVIGTKNAGTAATNSLLAGAVYNSTPLTLTNTQQASLQADANGYLKVNVAAGGAGGGAVYGPTANASPAANPPVVIGGTANGSATGNVGNWKVDAAGSGFIDMVAGGNLATALAAGTGSTGSAVPSSGVYIGINVSGNLRGPTGVNPSGSIYAQQVDIASIGGTTASLASYGVGATGSAPPANANYLGVNGSGATGGLTKGVIGCDASAVYDASTNGSTELVALTSGRTIYVCGYTIVAGGTANVKLIDGTGTACATSPSNLTPAFQLTAQVGAVDGAVFYRGLKTRSANALCINSSAGVAVQAIVYYSII